MMPKSIIFIQTAKANMNIHTIKEIELLFKHLCNTLKPKVPYVTNSLEYVQVGEFGLALEFICDWCVDATPDVRLTAKELLKIKEVGHHVMKDHLWIELLPILIDSEKNVFPVAELDNVNYYIEQQLIQNPQRKEWISKINQAVETIKQFA